MAIKVTCIEHELHCLGSALQTCVNSNIVFQMAQLCHSHLAFSVAKNPDLSWPVNELRWNKFVCMSDRIWDARSAKITTSLPTQNSKKLLYAVWTPNGNELVVTTSSNVNMILDVRKEAIVKSLPNSIEVPVSTFQIKQQSSHKQDPFWQSNPVHADSNR